MASKRVVVTGALGFIGTNLVKEIIRRSQAGTSDWIVNMWDLSTYAANKELIEMPWDYVDMRNAAAVRHVVARSKPEIIFHLAAESHVCRSIDGPRQFFETNTIGTLNLFEAVRELRPDCHIIHVSTDEVYGEAPEGTKFTENTNYKPRSPYAASKAASDHIAMSYAHTYGMRVAVTNCSNNFGPFQHSEKLIPMTITNALQGKPITLFGTGENVRDWIWVGDHVDGLIRVAETGMTRQVLFGGECEMRNVDVVEMVLTTMLDLGIIAKKPEIVHIDFRPTDDRRYAVDCSLAKNALDWKPGGREMMKQRIKETAQWYWQKM